jgi:hypothetical protein
MERWLAPLLAASALALLLALAWPLLGLAASAPWVPAWDEAKYGVAGLRLAAAFSHFDLASLWHEVNALSVWPPFFPLLESVAFLATRPEPGVARQLVVLLFAAALVVTCFSLGKAGGWLGIAVAAGLLASPLNQTFAMLAMLEIPGLFLLCVAWACVVRALELEGAGKPSADWWRATWLASAALFFCKYNYGLVWLVPLIGYLVAHGRVPGVREWRRTLGSAWTWAVVSVGALALLLRFTGGAQLSVQGVAVSITSAGNAFYALLVMATLRGLWQLARSPRPTWLVVRAWDRAWNGAVVCVFAPILLWLLIPPHAKDFVGFLENRSSDLPWAAGLSFYPTVLAHSWAPAPWFAWVLVALALPAMRHVLRPGPVGLAVWAAGAHWLAVILHGYKEDRFLLHAAFWLLVVAAFSISDVLDRAMGRQSALAGATLGLVSAIALAGVGFDLASVAANAAARCAPASTRDAVAEIARATEDVPAGEVLVLGTWNLLSPWWLEWQARLDGRSEPLAIYGLGDAGEATKVMARLRREGRPARVVVIEATTASHLSPPFSVHAFAAEQRWLAPIRAFLTDSGRYRRVDTLQVPASGYRLAIFAAT